MFLYRSKYNSQLLLLNGGSIPSNNSHSVIDKPELVRRVKPPISIIKRTNIKDVTNQYKNSLLINLSFENIRNNIYLFE